MREIKFRAWNENTKTMWWFDLMWGDFCYGMGYIGMLPINEKERMWGNKENRIAIDPHDCNLMQHTGLKDKNEKEIYEGDICSDGKRVGEIYYNESGAAFLFKYKIGSVTFSVGFGSWFEVIGNIYENPELLKNQ